jgi:hypothetical protein
MAISLSELLLASVSDQNIPRAFLLLPEGSACKFYKPTVQQRSFSGAWHDDCTNFLRVRARKLQLKETLMKAISTLSAALILSFNGTVAAQQTSTPEDQETQRGIPATQHQKQTAKEVKSDLFSRVDKDGDGQISQQEAKSNSALSKNWSKFDENADGRLDSQEFSAFERSSDVREDAAGTKATTEKGIPSTRHQEQTIDDDDQ